MASLPSRSGGAAPQVLPLSQLRFLHDFADSVSLAASVPAAADRPSNPDAELVGGSTQRWCVLAKGTILQGSTLKKGRAYLTACFGSTPTHLGRYYFEVHVLGESRVVLGLGSTEYCAVRQERRGDVVEWLGEGATSHIGYGKSSVGYDGVGVLRDGRYDDYGWWHSPRQGDVLCCVVDTSASTVAFGCNGRLFDPLPLPLELQVNGFHAVVSASTCDRGVQLVTMEGSLRYLPPNSRPFQTLDTTTARDYALADRSDVPPKPLGFYRDVAAWLSARRPDEGLAGMRGADLAPYARHIHTVEAALISCLPVMDLESSDERVSRTFSVLRQVITKATRDSYITAFPSLKHVTSRGSLPQVTVRWYSLFSAQKRTPTEALQHSVLAQLYRQMGPESPLLQQTPMFRTVLMMTDSGHVPVDAGGPYNQVWALLSEELVSDADRVNFHRNPLFRFVDNSRGKWIVPDWRRSSPMELACFAFLGSILGHMLLAKSPVALEISPFVWKFLVEDPLAAEDYYSDVEEFWRSTLEEDADPSLVMDQFGELFRAQLLEAKQNPGNASMGEDQIRLVAARSCLVHAMDAQLSALRRGMWKMVGRKCLRGLSAKELEILVCGEATVTFEQVKESVGCNLPAPYSGYFWEAMQQLSPREWSDFFYFASAQKRFPLSRKISVLPTNMPTTHLPVAHTCFATVDFPLYPSAAVLLDRLKKAIVCQVMELA